MRRFWPWAAAVYGAALLLFPQAGAQAARAGLRLCAEVIVPSLFPFFVLSQMALRLGLGRRLGALLAPVMGPLFRTGGAGGAALALGMVGGYPAGAEAVRDLLDRGDCSPEEAERLLCFCNNAGPSFVLSVAGVSVFGSLAAGGLLLAAHLLSALLVGVLLRSRAIPLPLTHHTPICTPARTDGAPLPHSVRRALEATLQVCAYIVLFAVLLGLAEEAGHLLPLCPPDWLSALLRGALELSNGVCALEGMADRGLAMELTAFLLGWGGLCVHCQTAALLEGSGLPLLPYLRAKAAQGLLSAALVHLALRLLPGLAASLSGQSAASARPLPLLVPAVGALALLAVVILTKRAGKKQSKPV